MDACVLRANSSLNDNGTWEVVGLVQGLVLMYKGSLRDQVEVRVGASVGSSMAACISRRALLLCAKQLSCILLTISLLSTFSIASRVC